MQTSILVHNKIVSLKGTFGAKCTFSANCTNPQRSNIKIYSQVEKSGWEESDARHIA